MSDAPNPRFRQPGGTAADQADPFVMANESFSWIREVVSPLGWKVVQVTVAFSEEVFEAAGLKWEETVGARLEEAQFAQYDGRRQGGAPAFYYYFAGKTIETGLHLLRSLLAELGLLALCKVDVADAEQEVWQRWFPADDTGASMAA